MFTEVENAVKEYCEAYNEYWDKEDGYNETLTYTKGKAYIKLIRQIGSSKGCYGFVDVSGNLWKCAGWKSPTKNKVRGNIFKLPKDAITRWEFSIS